MEALRVEAEAIQKLPLLYLWLNQFIFFLIFKFTFIDFKKNKFKLKSIDFRKLNSNSLT